MSRDAILTTVRAAQPDPVPHPGVPGGRDKDVRPAASTAPGGDLAAAFISSLEDAGGQVVMARESASGDAGAGLGGGPGAAPDPLAALLTERFPDAKIASTVPGVASHVDLAAASDPHELADLDVMVCQGELAVAENGAVWLTEPTMGHRAAPFLAQHMVVVLSRDVIVADLHSAYEAIEVDASGFGLFVAGPSKTADIEQSLVMGAHGPRSLTVVLLGGHG